MWAFASVAGAALIWIALLGPVITLFTHLSGSAIASALTAPGALDPLVVSLESGAVTLGVLLLFGTPLAWMLARDRLPFPRIWEAGSSGQPAAAAAGDRPAADLHGRPVHADR